jgi:hypothetical protein
MARTRNSKAVTKAETSAPALNVSTETGPVGIAQAAEDLRTSHALQRSAIAGDVLTVHSLIVNNTTVSKAKVFDALIESLGGKTNGIISSASLYRYATVGGLITAHGLPINAETVTAAYRLTESGKTEAAKAITEAKGLGSAAAFVKAATEAVAKVETAKAEADKAAKAKAEAATKAAEAKAKAAEAKAARETKAAEAVAKAGMTIPALIASVTEAVAKVKAADRIKALDALQDLINSLHAAPAETEAPAKV